MRCRRACTSTTSCPRSSASRSSTSSSAGGRCSRSSAGHRPSPPTTPRASRSPIRRRSTPRVRRERRRKSRPRTGRQPRPGPSAPPHGAARADEGDVVDMSAYREFTGKSVEEALRNAREAFGADLDDLDFEILTPGSRGVLGMGAEPARIVAAPRSALGGAAPKREAAASVPLPPPPPRAERADLEAAEASPEALAAGKAILEELMTHLGFAVQVEVETGETSRLNVVGAGEEREALGALIGRKGERLSALQHLVNLMLSRRMGDWTRVLVDVEDYRGRRERQLRDLAVRAAERVVETGKMLQLEPMPALERRWIHIALRDHAGVGTQSIGEEPNRRIVILPRDV